MSGRPDDAGGRAVDAAAMPVAFEARNEFEARCVQSVLEDAGIRSVTLPTGQAIFGFPMRVGSMVPVRVLPDDLTRARQAIAEARWVGRSVDWDDVDVGEMPPEVARMLARSRSDAWIRRGILGVAWAAILAVLASIGVGLFRALAVGVAVASVAGCAYRLEGKVVEGFGSASVGRAGDAEARQGGIPGAVVELVRDPGGMHREVAGRATSGPDGRFVLEVEGFGAGWMEERWMVRARRTGFENVESEIDLPGSPDGRALFLSMHRGRSAPFRDPDRSGSLIDEAKRWEPGIGGGAGP